MTTNFSGLPPDVWRAYLVPMAITAAAGDKADCDMVTLVRLTLVCKGLCTLVEDHALCVPLLVKWRTYTLESCEPYLFQAMRADLPLPCFVQSDLSSMLGKMEKEKDYTPTYKLNDACDLFTNTLYQAIHYKANTIVTRMLTACTAEGPQWIDCLRSVRVNRTKWQLADVIRFAMKCDMACTAPLFAADADTMTCLVRYGAVALLEAHVRTATSVAPASVWYRPWSWRWPWGTPSREYCYNAIRNEALSQLRIIGQSLLFDEVDAERRERVVRWADTKLAEIRQRQRREAHEAREREWQEMRPMSASKRVRRE